MDTLTVLEFLAAPMAASLIIAGIHAYPIRFRTLKIGVGGEVLMGRGRFQRKDSDGEPELDPVNRWLESTTWQVSLNFGRGQGWSYLTAGSGLFFRDIFEGEGEGDAPGRNTVNVGGGARWFWARRCCWPAARATRRPRRRRRSRSTRIRTPRPTALIRARRR